MPYHSLSLVGVLPVLCLFASACSTDPRGPYEGIVTLETKCKDRNSESIALTARLERDPSGSFTLKAGRLEGIEAKAQNGIFTVMPKTVSPLTDKEGEVTYVLTLTEGGAFGLEANSAQVMVPISVVNPKRWGDNKPCPGHIYGGLVRVSPRKE